MYQEVETNERILSAPFSSVQVDNHLTRIHLNSSISLRDIHLHANTSKLPQFNITNIIQRPVVFLFKSHSIIQDFILLFILLVFIILLFVLVVYRRSTKSSLSNENSI